MKQPFRSPENIATLKDLWQRGVPIKHIAARFQVNESSVKMCRRKLKLPPRRQGWQPNQTKGHTMNPTTTGPISTLKRVRSTFTPPPWTPELDNRLFELARDSFENYGVLYSAVVAFAAETGIGLDVAQRRLHLISRQTFREVS